MGLPLTLCFVKWAKILLVVSKPHAGMSDEFFHFMGQTIKMESRCHLITVGANGKSVKTHLGWARSVLYAIQNGPTPDLLDQTWRGYLRRLVSKGEVVLAMYLYKEYSKVLSVQELRNMNVFPNEPSLSANMFFLSWSAGFALFQGSNTGSQGAEAAHSPWQKQLEKLSKNWELEDGLSFMQDLYTTKWSDMYAWQDTSTTYSMLPPVRDPQLINGQLLAALGRSTFSDFCAKVDKKDVAHHLPLGGNTFVVMPYTAEQNLPDLDKARLGCQIISAHGVTLQKLLLNSGILYPMEKQDAYSLKSNVRAERLRCRGDKRRLHDLEAFCEALEIKEDGGCIEPLFSLQAYNSFFVDVVYVVRDPPSGISDTWPFLRCTCQESSKHSACEHIEYSKSLDIPGMKDVPNSRDNLSDPPPKKRRKRGSHTTARGKAASKKHKLDH